MDANKCDYSGSCHCGKVQFNVQLSNGMHTARRCDCSYCRMRGAVAVSAKLDDIDIVSGQEHLSLYQFGTLTAKHYFCAVCGIYTHHQRRSNPEEYGVNVACLEGMSPFDFETVPVNNGQTHPSDKKEAAPSISGYLKFIK